LQPITRVLRDTWAVTLRDYAFTPKTLCQKRSGRLWRIYLLRLARAMH